MGAAVGELERDPQGGEAPRPAVSGSYPGNPAPQAEQYQGGVDEDETGLSLEAEQAADVGAGSSTS